MHCGDQTLSSMLQTLWPRAAGQAQPLRCGSAMTASPGAAPHAGQPSAESASLRGDGGALDIEAHPTTKGHASLSNTDTVAVLRKIGWRLLPVFFALNCLNYLDRTNLAFASIQMSSDLQLTQSEYGTGAGLFFVGYATMQIPSQIILRHVGAPLWLCIIVTVWGGVACAMAGISNKESFYVVRLLLGIAEAGSFPAGWYYLTKFYPDKYIALPYSITDSAIMIAQARAPLLPCLM
jgi:sugar phosphate permease